MVHETLLLRRAASVDEGSGSSLGRNDAEDLLLQSCCIENKEEIVDPPAPRKTKFKFSPSMPISEHSKSDRDSEDESDFDGLTWFREDSSSYTFGVAGGSSDTKRVKDC